MDLPVVGALRPHPHGRGWLVSEPQGIPFFGGLKLPIIVDCAGEADEEEIASAISSFLKLSPTDRFAASRYVFAYYRRMMELIGEQELDCRIARGDEVWQHVQPSEIFISKRHRRDGAIYVSIDAECDWEPEHGLQLVYRRGSELVRVSDQDGHLTHTDAFDLPEDQDRIVS